MSECIGEYCKVCGHLTKIKWLFENRSETYKCKCNHSSNKNWFTKLLWKLNGSPAEKVKTG